MKLIKGKLTKKIISSLRAGEEVLYSGTVYTARDQAHKKLAEAIIKKKKPPIDLNDAVIYYTGPTPSREKNKVGSAGPTTSSRMDRFTPFLLDKGVGALIGKGARSDKIARAIKKNKAVYFLAPGGAGAYLSKRIKEAKVAAYADLGAEAIHRFEVEDFPLIVGIDSKGKDVYKKIKTEIKK